MISLLVDQAENYDIDGVHMFFCRGVPFVYFEKPFVEAFREEHGADARGLPLEDRRIWRTRARFFLRYMRELRAAFDEVGERRGKRLEIAMHTMNSPGICAYYGMDIKTMVRERLVDMLLSAWGHDYPEALGERQCTPEFLAEFADLARGTGIRICPLSSACTPATASPPPRPPPTTRPARMDCAWADAGDTSRSSPSGAASDT